VIRGTGKKKLSEVGVQKAIYNANNEGIPTPHGGNCKSKNHAADARGSWVNRNVPPKWGIS